MAARNWDTYRVSLRQQALELLELAPKISDAMLRERVEKLAEGIMAKTDDLAKSEQP